MDGQGAVLFTGMIDLLQNGYGQHHLYNDTEHRAGARALAARQEATK